MSACAENPTVSVLMAAYNAEESIGKAIDSVRAQTRTDWELIVVNDGSTDRTGEIIDQYSALDSRIRQIRYPNGGVAATRRRALREAKGEYVIYLDADDFIEPTMIEDMTAEARRGGWDITVADYLLEYNGKPTKHISQNMAVAESRELQRALIDGRLHGSLCNKLIRRETYRRCGCDFHTGLSMGEDMVEVLKMIRSGATTGFLPRAYYHYRYITGDSLSSRGDRRGFERRMEWIDAIENIVGGDFREEVQLRRFAALFYGLRHGVISSTEFYSYKSAKLKYIPRINGDRRYLPGMALACMGLFSAGKLLCKLVRK